ncbi:MAG: O-antigen ligase family protein [Chitinophagaceae bacterium]
MPFIKNTIIQQRLLLVSSFLVLASAILGLQWYNSIAIISFALSCIVIKGFAGFFISKNATPFVLFCSAYFLMNAIPFFLTDYQQAAYHEIEQNWSFLFLPLLFTALASNIGEIKHNVLKSLSVFCMILFLYLLGAAFANYRTTGNTDVFFYHQLVSPIHHNAVYVSVYVGFLLLYLFFLILVRDKYIWVWVSISILLYLFVLLLSSKTSIVVLTSLLIILFTKYYLTRMRKAYGLLILLILLIITVLISSTKNPVSKRFKEVYETDLTILKKDIFSTDMYFNALQFRLLAWKYSWQLVYDSGNYLFGIGPAKAQPALDQKYRLSHMYIGETPDQPGGYLGFNAHNQYVQTFLQSGIAGLLVLLLIQFCCFREAIKNKDVLSISALSMISIFFIFESALEGQFGIVLFLFFIPFLRTKLQILR